MIFVSLFIIACCMLFVVDARPVVRSIRSAHEFDRLLQKHSTETGLPVVVDFYSDGCGPCRMVSHCLFFHPPPPPHTHTHTHTRTHPRYLLPLFSNRAMSRSFSISRTQNLRRWLLFSKRLPRK